MNTSFSFISHESMDFFEYFDAQDENVNTNINRLQILNGNNLNSDENLRDENISNEQRLRIALYKKLKTKCVLSLIRCGILLFFFLIQSENLTPFLYSILSFLLIHEASTLTNFFIFFSQKSISRMFNSSAFSNSTYRLCNFVNMLNNFLLFIWFLYGNFLILTDKDGLEESLNSK